ncbi:hypothetical protein BKA57DRAFT_465749 [Linnemannia elongata]|nr:hypothetical protein BKA57DRAFT_465749 [Linnemannia elongata]
MYGLRASNCLLCVCVCVESRSLCCLLGSNYMNMKVWCHQHPFYSSFHKNNEFFWSGQPQCVCIFLSISLTVCLFGPTS